MEELDRALNALSVKENIDGLFGVSRSKKKKLRFCDLLAQLLFGSTDAQNSKLNCTLLIEHVTFECRRRYFYMWYVY